MWLPLPQVRQAVSACKVAASGRIQPLHSLQRCVPHNLAWRASSTGPQTPPVLQPGTSCASLPPALCASCLVWYKLPPLRLWICCPQALEGQLAGSHIGLEQGHQCLAEAYRLLAASGPAGSAELAGFRRSSIVHKRRAVKAMRLHYGSMSTQLAFEQLKLADMLTGGAPLDGTHHAIALEQREAEQQLAEAGRVLELFYGEAGMQLVEQHKTRSHQS